MIRIMQMLIFFGTICLICITRIASTSNENFSQTSQCIQPINYTIILEIQNISLIAYSTVYLNVSCKLQSLSLQIGHYCNTQEIQVQQVFPYNMTNTTRWKITTLQSRNTKSGVKYVNITFNKQICTSSTCFIRTANLPIQSGIYMIWFIHKCKLEDVATVFTYNNKTKMKEFLILTRIPNKWIFPYWENPATKARFSIQIKHKGNETALSNMPVTERKSYATNMINTLFDTTPLISTHLLAVGVVPNDVSIILSGKGIVRTSSRAINDTLYARLLIKDISSIIQLHIFPRQHHIVYLILPVNFSYYESIVTTGLVLLSEGNSIYDKQVDSIIREREVTCMIVRNVLQEMFSDWLLMFKQSDSWFLEGFLTVYGVYRRDQYYNTSLLNSIVVQTRRTVLEYIEVGRYDPTFQENSFIVHNSTLTKLWREKAFGVFYMLNTVFVQDYLYTSLFKVAVNLYYNTNKTSNNTYKTLSILNTLWSKNFETLSLYTFPFMNSTKFENIISSWTAEIGYPVVHIKRNSTYLVETVIDCFAVDHIKPCNQTWWIPVTYKQILNTSVSIHRHVLKPDRRRFYIFLRNTNEFVIVVDHPGYRVNYDRQSWKHIALFLKNEGSKIANLSDVTLAQLLDDAFYFLLQNTEYNENVVPEYSDLETYLELASSIFNGNNSYTAWYPIFIALEKMSKMLPFPESDLSRNIKTKLLEMLNKVLAGMTPTYFRKHNDNHQLYHEVLKWTCIFGSLQCKKHVNGLLNRHVKYPAQNKLLPSWQKWIYCQRVMFETVTFNTSALWQTIFNTYQTQQKKEEFFEFLPCSRQYEDLYNFFLLLNGTALSRFGDSLNASKSVTVTVLFTIFSIHSKNDSALDIILLGLKNGIGRKVNILAIINCVINNIYSDDGLSMITNEMFLNTLLHKHHILNKQFLIEAIKKKVGNRRSFLFYVKNTVRCIPYYVFNYKHTSSFLYAFCT
ncbi:aminopeptidase N-like isoform X1 [Pseudomyrmex gracilis]|uniref:aminopeptidase N-like isoform X1 n=1 Tax=Pseudomyrmex gracilis TaxID=219809 RepID=UPI0009952BF4|nr:aminopeptidase N-like isoform X1 [Pseudomyrmex gracilis]